MKRVKLSKGKFALVDDDDFEQLSRYKWYYSHGYAMRDTGSGRVYMHRLVNQTPEGLDTDHIDRNKLNNQRDNLRSVSHSINQINRGLQRNNTSGYVGVTWLPVRQKWLAQIKRNGKNRNLGYFDTALTAYHARKIAEVKLCVNMI